MSCTFQSGCSRPLKPASPGPLTPDIAVAVVVKSDKSIATSGFPLAKGSIYLERSNPCYRITTVRYDHFGTVCWKRLGKGYSVLDSFRYYYTGGQPFAHFGYTVAVTATTSSDAKLQEEEEEEEEEEEVEGRSQVHRY